MILLRVEVFYRADPTPRKSGGLADASIDFAVYRRGDEV
jgi:hypothetical protein